LACASPLAPGKLVPVETVVELTLQALTSTASLPDETPAPLAAAPNLMPHDLYFVQRHEGGLRQVFRIDADGHALRQITFEPMDVNDYDVSAHDGSIAYTSNNRLYLVDGIGAGRRVLIDGGPIDNNNRWTDGIFRPAWSPDGQTLAYNHGGLNLLDLATGASTRALDNQFDMTPGFPIVRELYLPNSYSPDGSRLLVDIAYFEGGTYGFYLPSSKEIVRITGADGSANCCYTDWAPDGSGVYITNPSVGLVDSGLYYADAATGVVTPLLPGAAADGTYNFARSVQVGSDDKLYFFFNNLPGIPVEGHTPLFLVRSSTDGLTGREKLMPDAVQNLNEVLWASDAGMAVVVIAPDPDTYTGGEAHVIYPDGRPGIVLASSARDLRWGP
jgi:hypothetical protein